MMPLRPWIPNAPQCARMRNSFGSSQSMRSTLLSGTFISRETFSARRQALNSVIGRLNCRRASGPSITRHGRPSKFTL
ncbi:hypothetical protein D3C78_1846290 [compost metagenome]